MKRVSILLNEVEVNSSTKRHLTAKRIVQAAINNLQYNCAIDSIKYIAYYRDYQLRDNRIINLNEGLIKVFDPGILKNDVSSTKISLLAYRENGEFPRDTITEVRYNYNNHNKIIPNAILYDFGGNELSILRIHDAIRNFKRTSFSFVNVFEKDFIKNHEFALEGRELFNETPLYHITFQSKKGIGGDKFEARGHIYIEQQNFSIHKLKYSMKKLNSLGDSTLYDITLQYGRQNSKMVLSYLSFNNLFEVKNPLDFLVTDVLLNRSASAIVVTFSNVPELKSASEKSNYQFTIDDQLLVIDRIEVRASKKQAIIFLKSPIKSKLNADKLSERVDVQINDIVDLSGRLVNKVTYIQVNQFREIFLQSVLINENPNDEQFINNALPLSKNEIRTTVGEAGRYWMNTPLKKDL
jgi:hypothetical protein